MNKAAAVAALREGRLADACSFYASIPESSFDREDAANYGSALLQSGKHIEAAYYLGRALEFGDDASLLSQQGMAFYQARLFAEAIDCFSRATEIRDEPGLRFNIGASAEQIGLLDLAEKSFTHALQLDPSNFPANMGLCRCYRRKGAYDLELELLLRRRPREWNVDIEISIFNCLHRLGRPWESMVVFNLFHGITSPAKRTSEAKLRNLHRTLWGILEKYNKDFGAGGFYQSFEELLIPGMRPTQARIEAYKIKDIINASKNVLDIGCNHGFLSLKIASNAMTVEGIDNSKELIEAAQITQHYCGLKNVKFICGDANEISSRYDVILSCAVHQWIGRPLSEYAAWLHERLQPSGYLIFESNDLGTHDRDFDGKVRVLVEAGFRVIANADGYDDRVYRRRAVVFERSEP